MHVEGRLFFFSEGLDSRVLEFVLDPGAPPPWQLRRELLGVHQVITAALIDGKRMYVVGRKKPSEEDTHGAKIAQGYLSVDSMAFEEVLAGTKDLNHDSVLGVTDGTLYMWNGAAHVLYRLEDSEWVPCFRLQYRGSDFYSMVCFTAAAVVVFGGVTKE